MAALLAVSVALVLQASVFSHLAVQGVVPDLVLLVVVAAGLAYGSELGLVLGFGAGLLLDLAPPADHYAGRWALALLVVGYVAGRLAARRVARGSASGCRWPRRRRSSARRCSRSPGCCCATRPSASASCSGSRWWPSAWDVALALVVVPLTLGLFAKVEPDRVLA